LENKVSKGQTKAFFKAVNGQAKSAAKRILREELLDRNSVWELLCNGTGLEDGFVDAIIRASKSSVSSNRYISQKVESTFGYPPTYSGFFPIEEQIQFVAKRHNLNPEKALTYAQVLKALTLPKKAEGFIAMPWWKAIASTYGEAVQNLCNKVAQSRKFHNYREGKLSDAYVQLFEHTKRAFETMREAQRSDILVFPAQAGFHHIGESILYARDEFLLSTDNEFGADPIMGFTILLNHPGRMSQSNEVDMDLPGVEYAPDGDGVFSESLIVGFSGAEVEFGWRRLGYPYGDYGSVSGFLPACRQAGRSN